MHGQSASAQQPSHDRHDVTGYVDSRDNPGMLLRSSEQQTRTAHIDALFNAPCNVCVAFGLKRGQKRDGRRRSAAGRWILHRGIERREHTGMQLSGGCSPDVRENCVRANRWEDSLMNRQARFGSSQRVPRGEVDNQERESDRNDLGRVGSDGNIRRAK